jgi:peroxiredoxin
MSILSRSMASVTTAIICAGLAAADDKAVDLNGRWAATTTQGGVVIPFRLEISGEGDKVVGTLFNGDDPKSTTSGRIQDGKVELNFEHYLTSIQASVKDGELDGKIISTRKRGVTVGPQGNQQYAGTETHAAPADNAGSPFHAKRYVPPVVKVGENVPSIDGVWEVAQETPKGEKAWRLIVRQKGSDITTTILRVDGDTGGLTGGWQDGKFVASHFDGSRPGLLELTPQADGSLQVKLNAGQRVGTLIAYRPEVARAKGLPEPANYLTHTSVRDPNEVFTYSFPDSNGNVLSNEDPKFKGKVVVAVVTGTWCPNCHDEAQYLVQLYARYHAQGLEIVALDFEEPDQQTSLTRVKAFIRKYGVPYPYLIAGAPSEMWDKVPQAVNLNTWPATFFIGKDGLVKSVHSGFAAPASGVYHTALKEEFTSTVERLLKEKAPAVSTESKPKTVASR